MEFEIQFTDITLLEADGHYSEVCDLMNRSSPNSFIKQPSFNEWTISSKCIITSEFGPAQLSLDFYHDGLVVIGDYLPSIKDLHNPDIRCLAFWSHSYGWKRPEPTQAVIDQWFDFWKRQWETSIVSSRIFDSKFGPIEEIVSSQVSEDDGDDLSNLDLEDLSGLDKFMKDE